MSILFSLYSIFLDEFKALENESKKLSFKLSVKEENSRFAKVELKVFDFGLKEAKFNDLINAIGPDKGKMRQYLGIMNLRDLVEIDPGFFQYRLERKDALMCIFVPLCV